VIDINPVNIVQKDSFPLIGCQPPIITRISGTGRGFCFLPTLPDHPLHIRHDANPRGTGKHQAGMSLSHMQDQVS